MPSPAPDHVVEDLDDPECRSLLTTVRIGRLGYTRDALPAIAPVPFCVHRDQVVIPSRSCSHLVPGVSGTVVAFQVDALDPDTCTGWTVTVVGPSRSVTDPAEIAALDRLPWPRREVWPDRCYISVAIGLVAGWRAGPRPDVPVPAPLGDGEPAAAARRRSAFP
ncbi:pyridoxamine 5'-phosphate oxidase family protein [Geodermatophilus sp. SYSU D00079]